MRCAIQQKWVLWLHILWWLEGGAVEAIAKKVVQGATETGWTHDKQVCTVHQQIMTRVYILTANWS